MDTWILETWILFRTEPTYEKAEAIKKCLKESFPGCKKIIRVDPYRRPRVSRDLEEFRGILVRINYIEGLSAVLYEEKEECQYNLVVLNMNKEMRETPVTHYSLDSKSYESNRKWVAEKFKLPPTLNIKKYLNRKKEGEINLT